MISPVVSSLADAALLVPAALLVLVYLAVLRRWRLALAFAVGLGAAATAILVLKLVFHACGHAIDSDVRVMSPSGHVSFGTAFYGSLALMLTAGRARGFSFVVLVGVVLLLAAVGISRVRVEAHTVPEVMIGFAVGIAATLLFSILHGWSGRPRLPVLPLAIGFAAAVALLGGNHFSLESRIARYARAAADRLDVCAPSTASERWRFSSARH